MWKKYTTHPFLWYLIQIFVPLCCIFGDFFFAIFNTSNVCIPIRFNWESTLEVSFAPVVYCCFPLLPLHLLLLFSFYFILFFHFFFFFSFSILFLCICLLIQHCVCSDLLLVVCFIIRQGEHMLLI